MTVGVETSQQDWVGNGVTTDFPPVFGAQNVTDLVVKQTVSGITTLLLLGTNYTLVGDVTVIGGYVVHALVAPPAGATFHVERLVPITQTTSFRTQGSFSPAIHEAALDKRCFVEQELDRRLRIVEALATLVPVATYSAIIVTKSFTTDATAVENTFPLTVALPAGTVATGVTVQKAVNNGDDTARFTEAVTCADWAAAVDSFTARYITGLAPGTTYTLTFQVLK